MIMFCSMVIMIMIRYGYLKKETMYYALIFVSNFTESSILRWVVYGLHTIWAYTFWSEDDVSFL
jgi:hypothetical protein